MLALDVSAYLSEHPQALIRGVVVLVFAWVIGEGMKTRGRRRHRNRRVFRHPIRRGPGRQPEDNFSEAQRAEIFQRANGLCVYCLANGDITPVHYRAHCKCIGGCRDCYEADHYIPVIQGGATTVENGRCSCREHNRMKGGRTVEQVKAAAGARR